MPPSIRASVFADLVRVAEAPPRWLRGGDGRVPLRPSGRLGLVITVLVLGAAVVGPGLAPHDPFTIAGGPLVPPSAAFPMGTDALGRDVLSAILHGARTSLVVATAVTVIAMTLGSVIGMVAGYRGGWIDDLLMRATELFQVIPRFFVAVVALAVLGPGLTRMVVVLGLTSWPLIARVVRGEVMAMRQLDFVHAAEALGAPTSHIIRRQLLPNVLPTMLVALGLLVGQVLLLEGTLAFLGLGDPGVISWGVMAAQAQGFLRVAWWLALFPGLAITLTVLGVNLLADAWSSGRGRE